MKVPEYERESCISFETQAKGGGVYEKAAFCPTVRNGYHIGFGELVA